jgi:hypothetical protein
MVQCIQDKARVMDDQTRGARGGQTASCTVPADACCSIRLYWLSGKSHITPHTARLEIF